MAGELLDPLDHILALFIEDLPNPGKHRRQRRIPISCRLRLGERIDLLLSLVGIDVALSDVSHQPGDANLISPTRLKALDRRPVPDHRGGNRRHQNLYARPVRIHGRLGTDLCGHHRD